MSEVVAADGSGERSTALTIRSAQDYWDQKQLAALKQLGLSNAPSGDLAVFFHQAKRTGLDPFARQLYMIERKGRFTIQTSIDGFRVVADRACAVRGWIRGEEPTEWFDAEGRSHTAWLSKTPPVAARYTALIVTPSGAARFSAVARFEEYSAGNQMWSKMPALMIAKCAEALTLRKAFPQDLSGLYTDDEMAQASSGATATVTVEDPFVVKTEVEAPASDAQLRKIHAAAKTLGLSDDKYRAGLEKVAGVRSSKELTKTSAARVIDALEAAISREGLADVVAAETVDDVEDPVLPEGFHVDPAEQAGDLVDVEEVA